MLLTKKAAQGSWEFRYSLVRQLHSASSGSWADTADGLFIERCKEMVGDSNHHVTSEFVFATDKNLGLKISFILAPIGLSPCVLSM